MTKPTAPTQTMVLDLVTLGRALDVMTDMYLPGIAWEGTNAEQRAFLIWLGQHRKELVKLGGLSSLASRSHDELNQFLVSNGFDAVMRDLNGGIGVVSILDMLIEWLEGTASKDSIYKYFSTGNSQDFPAVTLTPSGVSVWELEGYQQPLAQLHTRTNHSLWLMMADQPGSPIELALTAQKILRTERRYHTNYEGATVPMLNLSTTETLEWLLGLSADPRDGGEPWSIDQAVQQFRLGLNDKGARVRVASSMGATRGFSPAPTKLVFDRPFIGFFTQPERDELAVAAFFAGYNVWADPGDIHDGESAASDAPTRATTGNPSLDRLLNI